MPAARGWPGTERSGFRRGRTDTNDRLDTNDPLEAEVERLKRLVAELMLDKPTLRDITK